MSFATAGDAAAAAAAILTGAALVPGARRLLDDAIDEIQHQAAEAALRSMVDELSPEIAAVREVGVRFVAGFATGVEVLPVQKRPLKPKPHGHAALVKRQKKARL